MNIAPNTIIDGKYEVLAAVGAGGMGAVFQAIQHPFNRSVALKLLISNDLDNADSIARFDREAKALCQLSHRNIILFYGFGVWQKSPYMVTEFVQGTNLEALLANGPMPAAEAVNITRQICAGLQSAHTHGIIHRDLKPSNVMLTAGPDGKPTAKIIDFGLSKVLPGYGAVDQKLTEVGCAVGTVLYMSPEQCLGNDLNAASDIYGAACVLYHCLTGQPPLPADDALSAMNRHLTDQALRLSRHQLAEPVPPALQTVLDKAMAKRCEERYETAEEFSNDLDRAMSGKPIHAKDSAISQTLAVFNPPKQKTGFSQNATLSFFAAFCTLAVVAGGFFMFNATHQKAHIPVEARPERSVSTLLKWQKAREDSETLSLLEEGRLLIQNGKDAEGIEVLHRCLKALEREKVLDWEGEANILMAIAEGHSHLDQFSEAEENMQRGLNIRRAHMKMNNDDLTTSGSRFLSEIYSRHGKYAEAQEVLRAAIDRDLKHGSPAADRFGLPTKLAEHYIRAGNPAEAKKLVEESLARVPNQALNVEAFRTAAAASQALGNLEDWRSYTKKAKTAILQKQGK